MGLVLPFGGVFLGKQQLINCSTCLWRRLKLQGSHVGAGSHAGWKRTLMRQTIALHFCPCAGPHRSNGIPHCTHYWLFSVSHVFTLYFKQVCHGNHIKQCISGIRSTEDLSCLCTWNCLNTVLMLPVLEIRKEVDFSQYGLMLLDNIILIQIMISKLWLFPKITKNINAYFAFWAFWQLTQCKNDQIY